MNLNFIQVHRGGGGGGGGGGRGGGCCESFGKLLRLVGHTPHIFTFSLLINIQGRRLCFGDSHTKIEVADQTFSPMQ